MLEDTNPNMTKAMERYKRAEKIADGAFGWLVASDFGLAIFIAWTVAWLLLGWWARG